MYMHYCTWRLVVSSSRCFFFVRIVGKSLTSREIIDDVTAFTWCPHCSGAHFAWNIRFTLKLSPNQKPTRQAAQENPDRPPPSKRQKKKNFSPKPSSPSVFPHISATQPFWQNKDSVGLSHPQKRSSFLSDDILSFSGDRALRDTFLHFRAFASFIA
jgi:hypothetical protein